MPWGEVYLRQFDGRCIKRLAFSYGNRLGDFKAIMEHIKAAPVKHGDIAYEVEIFPEYKVQMILWEGDDVDEADEILQGCGPYGTLEVEE